MTMFILVVEEYHSAVSSRFFENVRLESALDVLEIRGTIGEGKGLERDRGISKNVGTAVAARSVPVLQDSKRC
jgi:hypothetical protein